MYIVSLFAGQYDWWNGDVKTALLQFIPSLLENRINILHWFVHMLLVIYLLTPLIFTYRILKFFELKKDELFSAISVDDYLLCFDYLYAIGKIKYVDERIVKNDN